MAPVHDGTTMLAGSRAGLVVVPQIVSVQSAGAELVAELPEGLALPAWQALRSVLQWALEEPASRGDIFEPSAMREWEVELLEDQTESELHRYLAVLVGELAALGNAQPEMLAKACICTTEWALEGKFTTTALAFAEAAALCWPGNARYAWTAGHLMQAHGRAREAEVWLKYAETAAKGVGDRHVQVLALRSRGHIHRATGKDREAGKLYREALRVARRYEVGVQLGEAAHDLFLATSRQGLSEEAEDHARTAFEVYKGGPNLPDLAVDLATWWLAGGYYARALTVIQHVPGTLEAPSERIIAHGALSHAAAAVGDGVLFAVGDGVLFATAASEVWSLAALPDALLSAGDALLGVAWGATHLAQLDEADRAAARAAELGHKLARPDVAAEAERMLARAETLHPRHPDDARMDSPGSELALEIAAALRNVPPGARRE